MQVKWVSIKVAIAFVRKHHRHRPNLAGGIVALGAFVDGQLVGVAVLGRPARMDATNTVTITRVATNGYHNACSALYAKAKRLAEALGFEKVKTFTELDEDGASLRAVKAKDDGLTKGGHWSRSGRPRTTDDTRKRRRWIL